MIRLAGKEEVESALSKIDLGWQAGQLKYIDHPDARYIVSDGCLFPCVIRGGKLSIHAAIHPDLRGKQAIKAGENLLKWAQECEQIKSVTAIIDKSDRKTNLFARWCGMSIESSDEVNNYYAT